MGIVSFIRSIRLLFLALVVGSVFTTSAWSAEPIFMISQGPFGKESSPNPMTLRDTVSKIAGFVASILCQCGMVGGQVVSTVVSTAIGSVYHPPEIVNSGEELMARQPVPNGYVYCGSILNIIDYAPLHTWDGRWRGSLQVNADKQGVSVYAVLPHGDQWKGEGNSWIDGTMTVFGVKPEMLKYFTDIGACDQTPRRLAFCPDGQEKNGCWYFNRGVAVNEDKIGLGIAKLQQANTVASLIVPMVLDD